MMQIFKISLALLSFCFGLSAHAAYKLPAYNQVVLDNGLTLFLMEQHEVPLIDISIVTKVGAINDGKLAGLSQITAKNLTLGTQSLTKLALDKEIDFIGANIDSSAGAEFSTINASFASKDQNKMLTLLRDMTIAPVFNPEEFSKYKNRHLLQLEQAKESPRAVINDYFNRLLFGENGYGSLVSGEKTSVDKVQLADLKKHHKKWFQPSNSAIVMVGDFDSKKVQQQLSKLFANWQDTQKLPKALTTEKLTTKKANVLLVNKEDAGETTFAIGGAGIARNNPDRVGVSVINTILGGRFTSWLNDALRVNAGLTYGARSRFNAYSRDGSFAISTFTKTATTVEAIDLALATYNKLWQQGIDQPTLDSAKAYVKGQFPPKFETSSQLAALLVNMYGYGFDESYINTFEQQVNALTITKTKELIKNYFPKDNLQYVLIGKASEIRDQVAKYGEIKETDINDEMPLIN